MEWFSEKDHEITSYPGFWMAVYYLVCIQLLCFFFFDPLSRYVCLHNRALRFWPSIYNNSLRPSCLNWRALISWCVATEDNGLCKNFWPASNTTKKRVKDENKGDNSWHNWSWYLVLEKSCIWRGILTLSHLSTSHAKFLFPVSLK